ncbi:MAG: VOC family protein [Spiribacter salinus]|uniref:VOC family protein n=1 Tax=Spiribacter salinus TaxID=1335746 RepID=A0A540VUA1_9GAMM|nr:MAG: VOC family protein [Spiribacter salinus]
MIMTDVRQATTADHVVINTLYDMDDAARCLASVGFCLTPRAHHTLGSINHLVVLDDSYLELVGLPREGEAIRKELLEYPKGINGLVFSENAPEQRYADLTLRGFRADLPQTFSRPVECEEGRYDALFTAVRLARDTYPAGRVYFCQHHTPELVWRNEWRHHDNTAYSLAGLLVVSTDPAGDAVAYGACINRTPEPEETGFRIRLPANRHLREQYPMDIRFVSENAYRHRYGDLGYDGSGRSSYFGAIRLRVQSMDALLAVIEVADSDMPHVQMADGALAVGIPLFNCLLEFVEVDDYASAT